jgi:hypothetical protein
MTREEFNKKWADVDMDKQSEETVREFKNDCFELYEKTGFLEHFNTPYKEFSDHNGRPFTVLKRLGEEDCDLENLPMWKIRFENGDIADCFPEEICKLEAEECTFLLENRG